MGYVQKAFVYHRRDSGQGPRPIMPIKGICVLSGVVDYFKDETVAGWIMDPAKGQITIRVSIDSDVFHFSVGNSDDPAPSRVKFKINLPRRITAGELAKGTVILEAVRGNECMRLRIWTPITLAAQLDDADESMLKRVINFLKPDQRSSIEALTEAKRSMPIETAVELVAAPAKRKTRAARKLIVCIALQRSGTTAFCEALGQHASITSYGEVFHAARGPGDTALYTNLRLSERANYFTFRERLIALQPSLSYPSPENVEAMLDAYLDHLGENSKGWALIDIKYNSWHHFETTWRTPGRQPHLMKLLAARGAVFVHIKRRDLLARFASEIIANDRAIFHAAPDTELPELSITLDPAKVSANISEARKTIECFDGWLAQADARIEVDYEDLLAGDTVSTEMTRRLAAATKLDFGVAPLPVPLQKVVPNPQNLITNWSELRTRFPATLPSQEQHTLDPDSKVAAFLSLSRTALRDTSVVGGAREYSYGRKGDLDSHFEMLAREFSGLSSLLLQHAVLVLLIRRLVEPQVNFSRFLKLWETDRDFLLNNLDSRWLVSACDTIADHHYDAHQRALAGAATLFINTIRFYESERLLTNVENVGPDMSKAADLKNRVGLYDGLTMFAIGQGDAVQNMCCRMERLYDDDTLASALLRELLARSQSNDTVLQRFRAVHRNPHTAW